MTLSGSPGRRWRVGAVTLAASAAVAFASPVAAAPAEGQILRAGGATAVAESYVVVFKDASVAQDKVTGNAQSLAKRHGGSVARTYQHALRGFEVRLTEAAAKRLAADPSVEYVAAEPHRAASPPPRPRPRRGAWTGSTSAPCR